MDPNLPTVIVRIALRQHGNITRQQLLELGLGAEAIKHRSRAGDLHRVHLGVYSVGRPATTALERAAAAVLACGPTAALSHASAMALWGFWKRWPPTFEVIVRHDRRPRGIKVHRSRTLTQQDLRWHLGIRVTSPARTLADMAPRLATKQLARTVNDALLSNYLTRSHLNEAAHRWPCLGPFADRTDGPTRSGLEDDFQAFCERHDLPRPQFNVRICGREVDAYFPKHRLIVELDGWRFHRGRESFERDRDHDAEALAKGVATVRITSRRLTAAEARRLRAILAGRTGKS
jgi:hypothetical protein